MKKFFVIALAAMSMTFVSCKKSVEAQAEAYVQECYDAMEKKDMDKMMKVAEEAEKWMNSLSDEDKAKAEKAAEAKSIALGMKEPLQAEAEAEDEVEAPVEEVAEAPADSTVSE